MKVHISLRENCPYSEFFWSVFPLIRTEYGEIRISYLSVFSPSARKYGPEKLRTRRLFTQYLFFFYLVFFSQPLLTTGLQGKGEGISLTLHYHFHSLHRYLDISREITAESSPLHIGSSRTRTGNLWFGSANPFLVCITIIVRSMLLLSDLHHTGQILGYSIYLVFKTPCSTR